MHKVVRIAVALLLLLLLLLASTALVVTRNSTVLPLWLTQLRSSVRNAPATHDALLPRRRMRAPRPVASAPTTSTTRATASSYAHLCKRIWQRIETLVDTVAAHIRSSSAIEARVPRPYAYDLWLNDDDTVTDANSASIDSDVCTTLYRDSTQHQVCAISI